MKVNLSLAEDELFRAEVLRLIEGQVRHVLREQLQGVVAGEIAKLRLLQPNSDTLSHLVEKELKKQLATYASQSAIKEEVRKQVAAFVKNVSLTITH